MVSSALTVQGQHDMYERVSDVEFQIMNHYPETCLICYAFKNKIVFIWNKIAPLLGVINFRKFEISTKCTSESQ